MSSGRTDEAALHNNRLQRTGRSTGALGEQKVKTPRTICMSLILLACFGMAACVGEDLVAVRLHHSGGWEIRIDQDGGGSYGFGALPARIRIAKGTFAFSDVIDDIERAFPRKPKNAEEPYMAISYWQEAATSAVEHYIAVDDALLERYFNLARANSVAPENDIEKAWHDQIEEFWTKQPPIPPNTPDLGDSTVPTV